MTPLSFVHDIVAYYDSLIGHDLAWPAVRIFTIVCAKAERIRDDKPYMRINELYWKLFNWIGPVSDANHGHAQSIDQRACRLWTQYSWLRYLESIDYLSLAPDLSESMQSDLSELLGLLPNSSPRGELAAFCSKIYRETHGFSEVSTTPDLNWSIITEEEHTRYITCRSFDHQEAYCTDQPRNLDRYLPEVWSIAPNYLTTGLLSSHRSIILRDCPMH